MRSNIARKKIGATTIFKRKRRGRVQWCAELTIGYDEETGRRRVKTFYRPTKREVETRLK